MEALAAPGLVYVHRSTADRWAKEGCRAPPPSVAVECGDCQTTTRAAVLDCAAGAFRGAPTASCPPGPGSRLSQLGLVRP